MMPSGLIPVGEERRGVVIIIGFPFSVLFTISFFKSNKSLHHFFISKIIKAVAGNSVTKTSRDHQSSSTA